MLITTILFFSGFVFLIKGASLLVDGSSSLAKKYGISNLVIGLTIVAFGTSMPELIVSSVAAIKGSTGVALGNIIGSNISNSLLILGVAAIIHPLLVKKTTVSKEIPLSLLAIMAVGFMVNDRLFDGALTNFLGKADGLVLILFFSIFIYYTFGISKMDVGIFDTIGEEKIDTFSNTRSISMMVIGLVGLYFGGEWLVNGAVYYAGLFGLSEALIGLTIIAIGTSLPELAASAVAAYKKHTDIAVGNVIGSNIFNLLWVLGVSSVVRPISYDTMLNTDILILFFLTVILLLLIYVGRRNILARKEGVVLILLYVIYLVFIIIRG